jgi:hypothetical protein
MTIDLFLMGKKRKTKLTELVQKDKEKSLITVFYQNQR